jgi:hypothetical protein
MVLDRLAVFSVRLNHKPPSCQCVHYATIVAAAATARCGMPSATTVASTKSAPSGTVSRRIDMDTASSFVEPGPARTTLLATATPCCTCMDPTAGVITRAFISSSTLRCKSLVLAIVLEQQLKTRRGVGKIDGVRLCVRTGEHQYTEKFGDAQKDAGGVGRRAPN